MTPAPLKATGIAAVFAMLSMTAPGEVVVSEFLADNRDTILDQDGEASDWIEVHNSGGEAVGLEGWQLSDDPSLTDCWHFPDIVIAPQGRIVVFASGKDRTDAAGELHTDFSLDAGGEFLALTAPDGEVMSEFLFGAQREDVSFGLSGNISEQTLIGEESTARWLVPTGPVPFWRANGFPDATWSSGETGIGFDLGTDYDALIATDLQLQMYNRRSSGYARIPFELTSLDELSELRLLMRYDDGFAAWINGVPVAAANAPTLLEWDSEATRTRLDSDALVRQTFDASGALDALVDGQNTLAIQFLNAGTDSSDLLLLPELFATFPDRDAPPSVGYLLTPTPGAANANSVEGFVADTKFSLDRGHYDGPIEVEITTATAGTTIRYTTDGSEPSQQNGSTYEDPVRIQTTTILRAKAFKDGFQATNVDTQTYLFPAEIKAQPKMDSDIVDNPLYSSDIEDDLRALPVLSLVVDEERFFGPRGIYRNPEEGGRGAEVPLSVEFFDPSAPADQFQIDAGVRIHGGNARSHPKKPLRLYFRGEYGDRRLRYPLFPDSPVESFDQLVLRSGGHDSWSLAATFGRDPDIDLPPHGVLMRDQFLRGTEIDMGLLSPRGRYVHTYINGEYWGIYDLHERPNSAFFQSHLGGDESDYDVLHHPEFAQEYVIVDGDAAAWEAARSIANGAVTTAAQYAAIQEYIDLPQFIDHLIVRMWSGDFDWCGPVSLDSDDVTVFSSKNWYVGRRSRGDGAGTFRFFAWDAEMSMGNHLMFNLNPFDPPLQRVLAFDLTGASDRGSPAEFYAALRQFPDFRLLFADRLQKHLFGNGAMTHANSRARWDALWGELRSPMVAESARWGDEGTSSAAPFTRNGDWLGEVLWVRNKFIRERSAILLEQFRQRGLYPDTRAPQFNTNGGQVASGFQLAMTSAGNEIYYTIDGSDPHRAPRSEIATLVEEVAACRVLVPSELNGGAELGVNEWTSIAEPPNAEHWRSGETGVGYERSAADTYTPWINLDLSDAFAANPGAFVRIPFELPPGTDRTAIDSLTLSMKYDDGFVAYLNGVRVAGANAPINPTWISPAADNRSDPLALLFEDVDISAHKDLLLEGRNVLAIHALNDSATSSDMLCIPRLTATSASAAGGIGDSAALYSGAIPVEASTRFKARAYDPGDGAWSALVEATLLVGDLADHSNLVVSEFSYRPHPPTSPAELAAADGRADFEFVELTNISNSSIDLTGAQFSQGIRFEFEPGSPHAQLGAGESTLIVADATAFAARYGVDVATRIAGEFGDDTKLNNDGERITVLAADGAVIRSFRYSDSPPWPAEANGFGYTLELLEPASNPDHNIAENWRASAAIGGTPAGFETQAPTPYGEWIAGFIDPQSPDAEAMSLPAADADSDRWCNLVEYVLGSSPVDGADAPEIEVFITEVDGRGFLAIRYAQATDLEGVSVTPQSSSDFTGWQASTIPFGEVEIDPSGRLIVTARSTTPVGESDEQMRLLIQSNQ